MLHDIAGIMLVVISLGVLAVENYQTFLVPISSY